jgi:hypothetical protein
MNSQDSLSAVPKSAETPFKSFDAELLVEVAGGLLDRSRKI